MAIRLPMAGLDGILQPLPDGCVILVEGGVEEAKDIFAHELANVLLEAGRSLTYASTREEVGLNAQWAENHLNVVPVRSWGDLPMPDSPDLPADLIVDDLGLVGLDTSRDSMRVWIEGLRAHCRASRSVAVLVLEEGLLDPARTVLLRHLAHGVLQFRTEERPDALLTYVVSPKWPSEGSRPEKVFYAHDAGRLVLDTRRRHA